MGAPTGSVEVCSNICPRDTGWLAFPAAKPLIAMVAAPATDCFLIAAQVAESGFHVWAAACCGVRLGGRLLGETHRRSIYPICLRSHLDVTWMPGESSANDTSIRHETAPGAGSRQRKVGAAISGGKTALSAGESMTR